MKLYAAFKTRKRTKAAAPAYPLRPPPPIPIDDIEAGPSLDLRENVHNHWYGAQGNLGDNDNDNERQNIFIDIILTDKRTITGVNINLGKSHLTVAAL